ncbi:MAG: protein translocase subunit SecF [Chloroflexota bacterium]|nr:protein translocase subunit SecF [Chloroflexota bacterium]MDE2682789.1 protein translocase subunit SecF [Chloroflexota bacterium]
MFNIVGKRGWYFLISALIIIPGLLSMIAPPGWSSGGSGLKPGIDFTSGSVLNVTFEEAVQPADVKSVLGRLGHPNALVQAVGDNSVLIRTSVLEEASGGRVSERQVIQDALEDSIGAIAASGVDTVSPIIAQETVRNTFLALLVASVFILGYIWYAFRRVPRAYRYGVAAVVTLAHDTLIVLGVFSILGRVLGMEVNSMFIVGILTVAGYSVNDTIVVFDRIRENAIRVPDRRLEDTVNLSIIESVGRSVNTSFTTLLVLLAMLLIGGESIRELLLVVAIGVVVGTYSSIFIAAQFIVIWERREFGRVFTLGRREAAA